jgi:hypothetical protein
VGAITNTKLTYKSETDALVIGAISIDRLSMECTEFARRRSLGLALSGSSFQRGDFPCFEKPSSLLPFLPRLVEQSLLPRLMLPRVEVAAVGVDMAVAVAGVDMAVAVAGVVVTVVAGAAVVTVVADSGVDMLAELAVGTLVALVAGMLVALVAVGLGVAVSVVARLAVSAAGWVVCAEPRLVLVSGQLDLMASAGEASESPAFTAGAFQSRQV